MRARRGWMRMDSQSLLHEISGYCRRVGMAESTFGRLAVNDGKLVSRLRFGGRVTAGTVERVRSFIDDHSPKRNGPASGAVAAIPGVGAAIGSDKNFRFYDKIGRASCRE